MAIIDNGDLGVEDLRTEAHLWCVDTAALASRDFSGELAECMSDGERRRYAAFTESKSRLQYLVSRVLRRRALSAYWPLATGDWRFERSLHGRPRLAPSLQQIPLRFSLSHTEGLVVCLITGEFDGGVDVERTARIVDSERLARRWFSSREAQEISVLRGEARQSRFIDHWTLKEAYMKARGLSSVSLYREASFELALGTIRATLADQAEGSTGKWSFALFDLLLKYRAAVCIHNDAQIDLGLELIQHDLTNGVSVRIDKSSNTRPKFGSKVVGS